MADIRTAGIPAMSIGEAVRIVSDAYSKLICKIRKRANFFGSRLSMTFLRFLMIYLLYHSFSQKSIHLFAAFRYVPFLVHVSWYTVPAKQLNGIKYGFIKKHNKT